MNSMLAQIAYTLGHEPIFWMVVFVAACALPPTNKLMAVLLCTLLEAVIIVLNLFMRMIYAKDDVTYCVRRRAWRAPDTTTHLVDGWTYRRRRHGWMSDFESPWQAGLVVFWLSSMIVGVTLYIAR